VGERERERGTASRWMPRHTFVLSFLRIHEETVTATTEYIAITPAVMATGRKVERIGTRRSSTWNGM